MASGFPLPGRLCRRPCSRMSPGGTQSKDGCPRPRDANARVPQLYTLLGELFSMRPRHLNKAVFEMPLLTLCKHLSAFIFFCGILKTYPKRPAPAQWAVTEILSIDDIRTWPRGCVQVQGGFREKGVEVFRALSSLTWNISNTCQFLTLTKKLLCSRHPDSSDSSVTMSGRHPVCGSRGLQNAVPAMLGSPVAGSTTALPFVLLPSDTCAKSFLLCWR